MHNSYIHNWDNYKLLIVNCKLLIVNCQSTKISLAIPSARSIPLSVRM